MLQQVVPQDQDMNNKIVSTAIEMLIFWNEMEEEQKAMSHIEKMWLPIVYPSARVISKSKELDFECHKEGLSERYKPQRRQSDIRIISDSRELESSHRKSERKKEPIKAF